MFERSTLVVVGVWLALAATVASACSDSSTPGPSEPSTGAHQKLSELLLGEFRRTNPSIAYARVTELKASDGHGYVLIGHATTGAKQFTGRFEDELFGVFLANWSLDHIVRTLEVIPSPRWYDYELFIDTLSFGEVVIVGRGATYGDNRLRRAYPLDGDKVAEHVKQAQRIIRLSPAAFSQLPAAVRTRLVGEGCSVPQRSDQREPHNVVSGQFAEVRQTDWAVLCSVDGYSTVRIYWGGIHGCPELPGERIPDWVRLSEDGKWTITAARLSPSQVRVIASDLDLKLPLPIHDGIDGYYCSSGRWEDLTPIS